VLQGGDFSPLGSEKTMKMAAWVVTATNHELEEDVTKGGFREDLYYRLSTIKIHIEPLRNRPEDIPHLINYYVKKFSKQFDGKSLSIPSREVIDKLVAYHWPGNVRELQNVLKRLMILGNFESSLEDLFKAPSSHVRENGFAVSSNEKTSSRDFLDFDISYPSDLSSLSFKKIKRETVEKVEKEVIGYVLEITGWNRSNASKILKISYKSLLSKIKEFELTPPSD
jgi:DNA-binding NtrC family response regulator